MKMKPIPELEGYFATEAGEIVSTINRFNPGLHKKKARVQNSGYFYVSHTGVWRPKERP